MKHHVLIISCWSLEFIKRSSQENRTENKEDQDPKAHRPSQTYTVLDVASNKSFINWRNTILNVVDILFHPEYDQ